MTAFITLTNTGYIDYTLNCLKSLEKIGFDKSLHCYCIGEVGYNKLTEKGYKSTLINEEENSNMQIYRTGNWSNITFNKFKIIYENLRTHDYVLITDGDIVYTYPDFLNYLIEHIGENDILIQNDQLSDNDYSNLCSGFMFIKSNSTTLEMFHPNQMESKKNIVGWGDQLYINEIKTKLRYSLLPLDLFPNGQHYYNNHAKLSPYIIHFNWVLGHEKKKKMVEHGKWYLE